MGEPVQIGRLAMRHEGEFWNAYYAETDTMDGAVLLGSIAMRFIVGEQRRGRKDAFMAMMRAAVSEIIQEKVGKSPTWREPKAAPFWEKST